MPNDSLNGTLKDENGIINGTINCDLSDSENSIIAEIKKNPAITTGEIVKLTGIPLRSVARVLKSLREKNIIGREGSKKTGIWVIK